MAVIYILALDATRKGGAGVYTWTLIENLVERGHKVTLICHEAVNEVKKIAQVIILPRPESQLGMGIWRFASIVQLFHYWNQLRKLKLTRPDIVIGSAQPMIVPYSIIYRSHSLIYLPHSFIAPVELESYAYGDELQKKVAIWAYGLMERYCLKTAKVTLRFTKSACEAFENYYGGSATENMINVPMPIKQASAALNDNSERPLRLLSVGRIIKSKNLFFLIDILKTLAEKPWKLDIVGSGDEMEALRAHCHSAGLDDRVTFHGHVENVEPFYRAANLFVFPSLLENSPVVLLEAMSFSLPTLSFYSDNKKYIGANHEIVNHQRTGFLARDDDDFKETLVDIIDGEIDISKIGHQAHRYVKEKHGWNRHIDDLEKLIQG